MAKNNAGVGSKAVLRKDGRWVTALDLGRQHGKRRRKYFYAATAKVAEEKLLKARADQLYGRPVVTERESVGEFLDRWLLESVRPSVRASTFDSYEQHVALYLKPAFGNIKLPKLTPSHIRGLISRQLEQGLSTRTAQLSLVTLRRALKQAERDGLIARNVGKLVDSPSVRRKEIVPLNPEQSKRLLEVASGQKLEALYNVLLLCGTRLGEALAVTWDDVNWADRQLTIRRSLARVGRRAKAGSKLVMQEPKTNTSRRVLHMPDKLIMALRTHRARQASDRLLAGSKWDDQCLVFCNGIGRPLEATAVSRDFKRLLKAAGLLPTTRLHDLRHSAASLLLTLAVPLKTIQQILGHNSIQVTADLYAHVAPQMLRDAADRMDAIFGSPAPENRLMVVNSGCQLEAGGNSKKLMIRKSLNSSSIFWWAGQNSNC